MMAKRPTPGAKWEAAAENGAHAWVEFAEERDGQQIWWGSASHDGGGGIDWATNYRSAAETAKTFLSGLTNQRPLPRFRRIL